MTHPTLHPTVRRVTERVRERSEPLRRAYLEKIRRAVDAGPSRSAVACSNLAHGVAACPAGDRTALRDGGAPNVAIVSAYNDMLSAHQPFETYPRILKEAARQAGGVAQFAGGVPAMCDGVTQGRAGMELSLWSRDVIALSTAVALSHDLFDAAVLMGVCDKIVPGLLLGALAFGHLPAVFVPAGPMPSGLANADKAKVRQLYEEGKASRKELLDAETASYHSPGTCTFYGTANSNQMLMELMGLHLPGASFVNPGTPLREALTRAAGRRAVELARAGGPRLGEIVDERALVNAVVGLLATGGSTNHTLHLVAIGRAAGVLLDWDDFDELSTAVPLLARIYPNGLADVNHFQAAGGLAVLIGELVDAGLVHPDLPSVASGSTLGGGGEGLAPYRRQVALDGDGELLFSPSSGSRDRDVLRPRAEPFQADGGLRLLRGNLGRAVCKVSAVRPEHRRIEAPARVFATQQALRDAFQAGELEGDVVAVVRFQGPRANGMPELHRLMPLLGVLQDRGSRVALVTDGRLSGASGKVLSALHVTPEADGGGPLARLRDGDRMRVDADSGVLEAQVDAAEWAKRPAATADLSASHLGLGRELFTTFRQAATPAEAGATTFGWPPEPGA